MFFFASTFFHLFCQEAISACVHGEEHGRIFSVKALCVVAVQPVPAQATRRHPVGELAIPSNMMTHSIIQKIQTSDKWFGMSERLYAAHPCCAVAVQLVSAQATG